MTEDDKALVEELARAMIAARSAEPSDQDQWHLWADDARAILPIVHRREASARAGVLHIGTMKVWRGQTPGTIFIQQGDGEGGEFPEADLEAIWQSYYAENF